MRGLGRKVGINRHGTSRLRGISYRHRALCVPLEVAADGNRGRSDDLIGPSALEGRRELTDRQADLVSPRHKIVQTVGRAAIEQTESDAGVGTGNSVSRRCP